MFIHETNEPIDKQRQKENDKLISDKFNKKNILQNYCLDKWNYWWTNNKFF